MHDEILGQYFDKFDVILLTETWSDGKDGFELHNFKYKDFSRKSRHANAKRASGGIGVFIKFDISDGVEVFRNVGDMLVWLKLKREYFNTASDIYLGTVYFPPEGSTCSTQDLFTILHNELTQLPDNALYGICGDFNSRTSTQPD